MRRLASHEHQEAERDDTEQMAQARGDEGEEEQGALRGVREGREEVRRPFEVLGPPDIPGASGDGRGGVRKHVPRAFDRSVRGGADGAPGVAAEDQSPGRCPEGSSLHYFL